MGGCLIKNSCEDAKYPAAIPGRRRISSLSREAQCRAYQWCREYLGGAWRQVRPEELGVCPVRSGVSLGVLETRPVRLLSVLRGGRGGAGLQAAVLGGVARSSGEVGLEWVPTNRDNLR